MDPQRGRLLSQDSFPPRSPNSSSSLHDCLVTTFRHSRSTTSTSIPSPYYTQSRRNSDNINYSADYSEAICQIQGCSSVTAGGHRCAQTRSKSDGEIVEGMEAMTAQLDRERSVGIFQALRCVTPLPVDVQKEERDGGKRRRMRDEKIKEVKPKMTDLSEYLNEKKEARKHRKGIEGVKASWWRAREWIVCGT